MSGNTGATHKRLAPTQISTSNDLRWAAGIFEGEGCVEKTIRNSCSVRVSQKDRWLCDQLRALFGGSVNLERVRQTPFGTSALYRWQICGARARGFMVSIYELLSPRRQVQVRKALSWN